jgi:hypothetical protein
MSDASKNLHIPFAAILACFVGVLAVTPPAKALEGVRGGFGGVQGWGGLYRDNRDVGSFPVYVAYGDGYVVEWNPPRRHSQVLRHRYSLRHRAVAHHCAPSFSACHCICQ